MAGIRADYSASKKQEVNGKLKTMNFKPWLQHTGRDIEFYTLQESHETFTKALKEPKADPFFVDTTKANNTASDILARAVRRPHPLEDMSSLPGSEDTVHFHGLDDDEMLQRSIEEDIALGGIVDAFIASSCHG
ncbi:hypothetical protein HRG_014642 [Hirsutella rhossiliensis]